MNYTVKVLGKDKITHDVVGLTLERPGGYSFRPGQRISFGLERPDLTRQTGRFSLTGLNSDPDLKIAVKTSPDHAELNTHVRRLETGDRVSIGDPEDEVAYRGPGVFIAGGTGISPFMAIFRQLHADGKLAGNSLIYANKRGEDICFEGELYSMFGTRMLSVLALEDRPRNIPGEVDADLIREHFTNLDQPFYVCGPEPFVNRVADELADAGVKRGNISCYC
jgi:ferredoxin-NADP reductase